MSAPGEAAIDRPAGEPRRRIVLVLGMHRSGTSALARALHTLGLGLPGNLLPPAPDNPAGYFESRHLTRLDERILTAAGTAWHDPAVIPEAWFSSAEAVAFREHAESLVNEAFAASPTIVLKDPRLCRLLPFWRACLADLNVAFGCILILRDPREVARSLQVRVLTEKVRPGGTLSIARAHWLWLRYVLDAEDGSRGLPRTVLTYEMLLDNGPWCLAEIARTLRIDYPVSLAAGVSTLENVLSRKLKRQHSQDAPSLGWPGVAAQFYQDLAGQIASRGEVDHDAINSFREAFERVQREAALANEGPVHSYSPAYGSALLTLGRARAMLRDEARLLFVSGSPDSRGHLYRVEHHVQALVAGGLQAEWRDVDKVTEDHLCGVTIVVVFRAAWNPQVAALYTACRARGITIAFDIDDLVFDPAYMREPYFDYVRTLGAPERERWAGKVTGWRQSLLEADCAIVSTAPLAAAAEALGRRALVWSNGITYKMIDEARRLPYRGARQTGPEDHIRLGYASGAPTHQKDFARIAAPLARVLTERPAVTLTIAGYLDLTEYPELAPHALRIEQRPFVPHDQLAAEYARFDINLAPLEAGNPFCEAKSELKYFEAALTQVPTVASATAPYAGAIQSGINGYIARDETEWRDHLIGLIDDRETRERVGREAYWHALVRFGPEAQSLDGLAVIDKFTADR